MKVYYDIAYTLAESLDLIEAENPMQRTANIQAQFRAAKRMGGQEKKGFKTDEYKDRISKEGRRASSRVDPTELPTKTPLQKRLTKIAKRKAEDEAERKED